MNEKEITTLTFLQVRGALIG